jgi:seryl-tRNA synthetase
MIDLKSLRADPEHFRTSLGRKRFRSEDLDRVLTADAEVRLLKSEIEELRATRNSASRRIPQVEGSEKEQLLEEMKTLAARLKAAEPDLRQKEEALHAALLAIPNPPHADAPDGAGDDASVVVREVGKPVVPAFEILDHQDLGELRGWIDVKRAAKVSGARFAYLMGDLVDLEFALIRFAMDQLKDAGYLPVVPPILVREAAMYGTGFFPADRNEIYKLEDEDSYLIGTSEVSLATMHMDEVLATKDLPLRYAGFSTCLRREAGTYGKDTRGIFRVHQFDKVEMFSFCKAEDSDAEHGKILAIEEAILASLEIPYRVVNVCTGELGAPAARKFDLEAWMPGQNAYREVTSCSNCTDYQARRLGARHKGESGTALVHTLNGTAIAIGRTIIALLENHQQEDRSILIPDALRPYLGGRRQL